MKCAICGGPVYLLHKTKTCVGCNQPACTCRPVAVVPRWLQMARQREHGLARDLSRYAA